MFGKKVVATILEEEQEQFDEINAEREAIQEMQNNLTDSLTRVKIKEHELWGRLKEKYQLPSGSFNLVRETREIVKN